jgi:hypothetical protein
LGELAFRRKALTDVVLPVRDRFGELAGDVFVQTAGFDHGAEVSG